MNFLKEARDVFIKIKKFLLDLIFPIECVGCGKEGQWICNNCLNKINVNSYHYSNCSLCNKLSENGIPGEICSSHKLNLDGLWIAADYNNEIIQKAIHNFKYNFIEDLHCELSLIIIKFLTQFENYFIINNFFDYIVPVPLHKRRGAERGFNQSELLAVPISRKINCPVNTFSLERKKYTVPQVSLSGEGRRKNLLGAFFCVKKEEINGKNIILIDDIYTTGSTMEECSKVLKEAGAQKVWGLVVASSKD